MQSAPGRSAFLSPSRSRHGSPSRLSTSQALQMLHEVSEETNQIIHSLQQEVEAQKRTSLHVQREKEQELQQQKDQLQSEKDKALDLLKERLIQEHIEEITNLQRDQLKDSNSAESRSLRQQLREKDNELRAIQRNMAKWKEETATKLACKFEEELNADLEKSLARSKASESHRYAERPGPGVRRLSMDRRENSHLRSVSTPSLNGAAVQHDFGALKILRHLQGRVRELRTDNKPSHGISMDDLTMQRTDMANSYREKRPLICERSISQSQGTMRK
ncbi:trichohyalin-like [Bombina bombina]|uniref:trichohyalin-like n=1 Tax=Bombina bombina TaxID=8345 RepID=UPI00235A9EBD|nr:trichohyalin-like [Bombina bombina]